MNMPIPIQVTIVPKRATSIGANMRDSYRALIHSIDEKDKHKLRRFVNSVFTRLNDQKRSLDKKELEELKRELLEEDN